MANLAFTPACGGQTSAARNLAAEAPGRQQPALPSGHFYIAGTRAILGLPDNNLLPSMFTSRGVVYGEAEQS